MDINIERSVTEEKREAESRDEIKGIVWTLVGVLVFTIVLALAFRCMAYRLGLMV